MLINAKKCKVCKEYTLAKNAPNGCNFCRLSMQIAIMRKAMVGVGGDIGAIKVIPNPCIYDEVSPLKKVRMV